MKMRMNRFFLLAALALCGLVLGACQTNKHTMIDRTTGKTTVCRECYDAVTAAHNAPPTAHESGIQTLRTYQCPCCKTEMTVYIQDGTHMVKCDGCARKGVAWDKCLPPDIQAK